MPHVRVPQLRSYLIQPRRRKSAVALLVAVTALLAATSSTASPTVSAKQAEAQRVLGEIQAIDSSLDKAVDAYNAAQMKLDAIRAEEKVNQRHLVIARGNFKSAQATLANRLLALYKSGDDNVLEVLLGSRSLSELLERVDTISRVFFSIIHIIVRAAPIGAFGAMAYTVGRFGAQTLGNLGVFLPDVRTFGSIT